MQNSKRLIVESLRIDISAVCCCSNNLGLKGFENLDIIIFQHLIKKCNFLPDKVIFTIRIILIDFKNKLFHLIVKDIF